MLWLLACAPSVGDPPAECARMCEVGERAMGACLDGWGLDWPALGYADAADWQDSCLTWVWEERQVTTKEGSQALVPSCEDKERAFADGSCDVSFDPL